MLSDKLISDKTQYPRSDDSYEPRPQPQRCTPLDQTFACGFVLVSDNRRCHVVFCTQFSSLLDLS